MEKKDYQILENIGSGAFSSVYKVKSNIDQCYYAMKIIEYSRLTDKEKDYAKDEIKVMKKIKNPHIIALKSSFIENDHLHIVMELGEGGDLQQKIVNHQDRDEDIPMDLVWKYFYQILSGLQVLHENSIIHRDVKPANVFITRNGDAKLGDFNVCKENARNLVKTRIGTPLIMSPEVLLGKEYDFKTDIWSLGCVVYELATLQKPVEADFEPALYEKVKKMKINVPRSKQLEKILRKMLRHNFTKRPSCCEILQEEEFRRFRPEFSRRKEERKQSISFRAPSLVNLSINKEGTRRNIHESPSGRKLRYCSEKNLKAISCERPKILHKNSGDILNKKMSPLSPNWKYANKSNVGKEGNLRIPEGIDSSKNIKVAMPKIMKLPIDFSLKMNAQKAEKEFKGKFGVETGSFTALSAPRLKQAIGVYLNDIYIVKGRKKNSRTSFNNTNVLNTPVSSKAVVQLKPVFQVKNNVS